MCRVVGGEEFSRFENEFIVPRTRKVVEKRCEPKKEIKTDDREYKINVLI
jgi:hypothetical protein